MLWVIVPGPEIKITYGPLLLSLWSLQRRKAHPSIPHETASYDQQAQSNGSRKTPR